MVAPNTSAPHPNLRERVSGKSSLGARVQRWKARPDNGIGPLTWLPLESIGRRGEEKEGLANRREEREINARRCVSGRVGALGSFKVEVLVVVVAGDGWWGVGRELEEY